MLHETYSLVNNYRYLSITTNQTQLDFDENDGYSPARPALENKRLSVSSYTILETEFIKKVGKVRTVLISFAFASVDYSLVYQENFECKGIFSC